MTFKTSVTVISALVVGTLLGRYVFPLSPVVTEKADNHTSTISSTSVTHTNIQSSEQAQSAKIQSIIKANANNNDQGALLAQVHQKLQALNNRDMDSLIELHSLVKQLTPEEQYHMVDMLLNDPKQNTQQLIFMVEQLAKHMPLKALQLIENKTAKNKSAFLLGIALNQWGKQAPQAAFDYYLENRGSGNGFDEGLTIFALEGVFERLAQQDDTSLWLDTITKLKRENTANNADQAMASFRLAEQITDPEKLAQFYLQLQQSPDISSRAASSLLDVWANKSPDALMQKIDSGALGELTTSHYDMIAMPLIQGTTEQATHRANWLLDKIPTQYQQDFVERIATTLALNSPEQALNWLNQKSSNVDVEQANASVISTIAMTDPDLAASKIASLPSVRSQENASYNIYSMLAFNNPERAQAFLNSSPHKLYIENTSAENKKHEQQMIDKMRDEGHFIPPTFTEKQE